MIDLNGVKVGFALTGSFCMLETVVRELENLKSLGADITPIMSEITANTDTRFGASKYFCDRVCEITGKEIIKTIPQAEPIGPKKLFDILIIAPCTGNTITKLALGITDTSVTMAAKAHLRNNKPLVIAVSSNDGLSNTAKNIGLLLNSKNIFLVPFWQDDCIHKQTSAVANMSLIPQTLADALELKQTQPLLLTRTSIQ